MRMLVLVAHGHSELRKSPGARSKKMGERAGLRAGGDNARSLCSSAEGPGRGTVETAVGTGCQSPLSQPPAGAIPPAQSIELAMKVGKGFTGLLWSQKGHSWGHLHGHVNGRPT